MRAIVNADAETFDELAAEPSGDQPPPIAAISIASSIVDGIASAAP